MELNEIFGTQINYFPAENILKNARDSFFLITGIVLNIFAVVINLINLLLKTTVLTRIKKIASVAEKVSGCNMKTSFGKQN